MNEEQNTQQEIENTRKGATNKGDKMTKDKTYIGKVEAWEIACERNIDTLPRKGTETLTVHAIASGQGVEVLGKDEHGFYVGEFEV